MVLDRQVYGENGESREANRRVLSYSRGEGE